MSSQSFGVGHYLDRKSDSRLNDTQINTSNSTEADRHNVTWTFLHDAEYKLSVSYDRSLDSNGNNFEAYFEVDGDVYRSTQIESKDSAGPSINGSGTDQRVDGNAWIIIPVTAGDHAVRFWFQPQTNGVEATIHDSTMAGERWI